MSVNCTCAQSEQREKHIKTIQGMELWAQRELMLSIEQVSCLLWSSDEIINQLNGGYRR